MGAGAGAGAAGFVGAVIVFAGLVGRETGRSGLSSATLIFGVRACSRAMAKGFCVPFGVEEKTSESG
jgi:hypothetical protein